MQNRNISSEKIFKEYVQSVVADSNLSINQIKIIFLKALKDYFENKINLGQLGFIADKLAYIDVLNSSVNLDSDKEELKTILHDAGEIDYYYENLNEANK